MVPTCSADIKSEGHLYVPVTRFFGCHYIIFFCASCFSRWGDNHIFYGDKEIFERRFIGECVFERAGDAMFYYNIFS